MEQNFLVVHVTTNEVLNFVRLNTDVQHGWNPPLGTYVVQFDGPWRDGWIWDGMKACDPNPPEAKPEVKQSTDPMTRL